MTAPYTTTSQNQSHPTNPLDEKPKEEILGVNQIYEEKDAEYLSFLQTRLENAKRQKEAKWPELNNKTPYEYYEENEKIANTNHLEPKKNEDDVVVSAGTIEQKLDALLSHINNLNLTVEINVFDRENNNISSLARALEDIVHETEILDGADGGGDEEKKMNRQRELLKQGTVFVQEEWLRKFETKKKLKKEFDGKFKQDADFYTESLELVFEGCSRTMLHGPNVYLGDMTAFYMEDQPYAFVMVHQDYDIAKTRFQKFDNWKYVVAGAVTSNTTDQGKTIFDNKFRLTELKGNQVEIIYYQDPTRDEFQILINGVCMLPIGFPLSAVSPGGRYNIAKQVFRVLNEKFALGGSFVSSGSVKEISKLIDEMLKLFVLKTRKSFTPSYLNTSGRVIDRKVLSPGRISMGIDPSTLTPIAGNEVQGVTSGEVAVLQEMQGLINKNTVSDQFQGQESGRQQTATQTIELQRQARMTLNLTVAVCSLLEKKLGYLRLWNILQNWFNPIDTKVDVADEARKVLTNVYRKTNRETSIDGSGLGERMVIPMDGDLPSAKVIRKAELQQERITGYPVRKIYLSPSGLKAAKLTFFITVIPKEKDGSPLYKMQFREELTDMLTMMQFGSMPNRDGLEEDYANIHRKSRSKLFQKGQVSVTPDMAGVSSAGGTARGRANPAGVPQMPGGLSMSQ